MMQKFNQRGDRQERINVNVTHAKNPSSKTLTLTFYLIVQFDTWNIVVRLVDPISSGRAVMPAVQKAQNQCQWSVVCGNSEKLYWRTEQPARIPDHGTKIAIFRSKPLHRTPMQNRPKTAKSIDCSISTTFFWKFVQTPCLTMLYHNISWRKKSKTGPRRF